MVIGLPGLIGIYSAMNSRGVSMNFNYFRSCGVSKGIHTLEKLYRFGTSILMQLRFTLEYARTSDHGVKLLGSFEQTRGCPYLVMICDPRGAKFAKSIEMFGSKLDFSLSQVKNKIEDLEIRKKCGSSNLLRKYTPRPWKNLIVRTFTTPQSLKM